ncbi:MAG: hypothetical protein FGM24_08860 [Candidatus Kapabacteria bacterium]|nr:hypothetical protein [Candidatus Kapabacteria bacterium]
MNCRALSVLLTLLIFQGALRAQDEAGPQLPIVLEHADSLVGRGPTETAERSFLGNVRFRQGNVTVVADRAVHHAALNMVDLLGRVRVTQGNLTIEAPAITYNGSTYTAHAGRGVTVREAGRIVKASEARYSTKTHIVRFLNNVRLQDDSMRLVADTLVYDRDANIRSAWGSVVMAARDSSSWLRGDTLISDAVAGTTVVNGRAEVWRREDSVYLAAHTLTSVRDTIERYQARGDVRLLRGDVAARSDSMVYDLQRGLVVLRGRPVVWSDSTMLIADSIDIDVPGRKLRSVRGTGSAFMASRQDTSRRDRFDQLMGDTIVMHVDADTLRMVEAIGNTRSLYFGSDEGQPQGLAQFASDTTRILMVAGTPDDIVWLGGIRGEHHPESIVAGRTESYRLPGFIWRNDRPVRTLPPDIPFLRDGSM